ncbi:MAG: hypothetical protein EKK37_08015 [Sphingobacteriales bacterium]|nr:MAG: hypothetical protein EKK37_08015 [Sphingobacteriales bacterium]
MWRKQLIAILIIFSLALQSFQHYAILAEFYWNRDYIAKNLCENRNKPQMHCNGKCHLKKQLQKEEQQQQNNNRTNTKEPGTLLFCNEVNEYCAADFTLIKNYTFYSKDLLSPFSSSLLRPPCYN